MKPLASIDFQERGDLAVAALEGEIDSSNAAKLATDLAEGISNVKLGVVLDLSRLSYLDSAGVHLMFRLAEHVAARQQKLALVVPAEDSLIRQVLVTVDMERVAPIRATVEEAAAKIQPGEAGG